MKNNKKSFELPYAGIDTINGHNVLYTLNGDYSIVMKISNSVLQYCADPQQYFNYQHVLLNASKILGENHVVQKQDIFIRKRYQEKPRKEFLEQQYQAHFKGRKYTEIQTYIIFTHQVQKGAFYTYDQHALNNFLLNINKIYDLLVQASLEPEYLNKQQTDHYVRRVLSMDFTNRHIAHDNIQAGNMEVHIGNKAVRSISLIDTERIDLPEKVGSYLLKTESNGIQNFPVDNFFFLYNIPEYHCFIYNQIIEIPSQRKLLNHLEIKRNRHSGIPDPANSLCVEDIDRLLIDVARENQLLVHAHYCIVLCCEPQSMERSANFIESALFQQGIIPSRNAFNQLELFRCALPGNSSELKKYDKFLTTIDAALCLFFKERLLVDEKSNFLLTFTDRSGLPVSIDPSDLPMRTGRIKNRNRFVLGSSGTGKSYAINAIVQQYLQYNMDVVIVDVGHSYWGLCRTYGGKYITYSEENPITMNPFALSKDEFNIEKKDFLVTLICLLWKGSEGTATTLERDVIAKIITDFYSVYFSQSPHQQPALNFNAFYDYAKQEIPQVIKQEKINFDAHEFCFVLKKFYLGGEYETILNEAADSSLFDEPFIVYEIDNIQQNKILLPIVTLIIMDLFIQKMRHRKNRRKTLILEEAWRAISSPIMANFLLYLNKTVRKFYGEIIEVTQEINDIIGNPIIKDSIINNSDTVILLQQNEADFKKVAELLNISEVEQRKIFTINKLDNKKGRSRFNEFYMRRGSSGEVYGVEVSLIHHLAFTTEKPEKSAVEIYASAFGSYPQALSKFVTHLESSKLPLNEFVEHINKTNAPYTFN